MTKAVKFMESFEVGDQSIYYCKIGNGPHPILCLPDCLGTYKDFIRQLEGFDHDKFTIVAWDPPGYGRSRPPIRKQSLHRCEKDAKMAFQLMQRLGLMPFSVMGCGEGVQTALHLANQQSDQIKKLVLWSGMIFVTPELYLVTQGTKETANWPTDVSQPYVDHYGEKQFSKQWSSYCDLIEEVYEHHEGKFPSFNVVSDLPQPTLVLRGTRDRMSDPHTILEKIPTSRMIINRLGSNDLQKEYADWFNEHVQDFLLEPII